MSDDDRPEILSTDTGREILIGRLEHAVERAWRQQPCPGVSGEPSEFTLSTTAVTAVLRELPLLSARQLAVLLADEASRKRVRVIHEPPRYA